MKTPSLPPNECHQRIVVGVDGSPPSLSALAWASELATEGDELHVVTCGQTPKRRIEATFRALAQAAVEPSRMHEFDRPAAAVLTEFAIEAHADLLVIGSHDGLPGTPRLLGSVAHHLLRSSPCPLAIVPENAVRTVDGAVVVGVGDGPATLASIEWSARFAMAEGRPVQLVRAVNLRPIFGVDHAVEVMASYIDSNLLEEWAEAEVELVAAELTQRGLHVARTVNVGRAGKALVKASDGARVVVVGKHLDGPITGYFTGVTLHHVLTHAHCPIVVVAATVVEASPTE